MSKAFTAISYLQSPQHFLAIMADFAALKGSMTAEQFIQEDAYQKAIEAENYTNLSFIVEKDGEALALVLAHRINRELRYNHLGVAILLKQEVEKSIRYILEELSSIAVQNDIDVVIVDDRQTEGELSLIGAEAYNLSGQPHMRLEAIVDLQETPEEIHKKLRKSYKSLVNQGRKEMSFVYVTADNPDHALFEDFRNFHKQVAGKVTRAKESWDVQYEMIKQGQSELILGYLPSHGLVSSALFNDAGNTTVYSVAVYNRDLFDYPLAHANVYEGLMRAKDRGQKYFYLGQIPVAGTVSEKEFNIGKFKKGFCDRLKSYIEWQIPIRKVN